MKVQDRTPENPRHNGHSRLCRLLADHSQGLGRYEMPEYPQAARRIPRQINTGLQRAASRTQPGKGVFEGQGR